MEQVEGHVTPIQSGLVETAQFENKTTPKAGKVLQDKSNRMLRGHVRQ